MQKILFFPYMVNCEIIKITNRIEAGITAGISSSSAINTHARSPMYNVHVICSIQIGSSDDNKENHA